MSIRGILAGPLALVLLLSLPAIERIDDRAPRVMSADPLDCSRLDATLQALVAAADPARVAAERRLHYVEGRVRVIIELVTASSAEPSTSSIVTEARYGRLIQALVPVGDLCALSTEPEVRRVRVPLAADASPQTPR